MLANDEVKPLYALSAELYLLSQDQAECHANVEANMAAFSEQLTAAAAEAADGLKASHVLIAKLAGENKDLRHEAETTAASASTAEDAAESRLVQLRAETSKEQQLLRKQCEKLQAQLDHAAQTQPRAAITAVSSAESKTDGPLPTRLVQSTKSYAPQTPAPLQAMLPTLSATIAADPEHPHARWMELQMSQEEAMPHVGISADIMLALANAEAAPRITTVFQECQLRAWGCSLTSCRSI